MTLSKELVNQGVRSVFSLSPPADGRWVVLRSARSQSGGLRRHAAGRRVAQAVAVGSDTGLHGSSEALPQLEPVGDLQSLRGTTAGTLGVRARPVRQMISTPG